MSDVVTGMQVCCITRSPLPLDVVHNSQKLENSICIFNGSRKHWCGVTSYTELLSELSESKMHAYIWYYNCIIDIVNTTIKCVSIPETINWIANS
jgi:D-mannonate dehydratase